jgi:hypothetical protein
MRRLSVNVAAERLDPKRVELNIPTLSRHPLP